MRVLPIALLFFAGVAVMAVMAFSKDIDRTSWELTQPPGDDTTLNLGVFVGGCDRFDHFTVREVEVDLEGQPFDVVTIEAYLEDGALSSCDSAIHRVDETVELSAPLGDRPLRGCNPPSAAYGSTGDIPNDDCASWVAPQ